MGTSQGDINKHGKPCTVRRTSPSYVTALHLVYMYTRGVEGAVSDVGAYVGIVVVVVVVVLVLVVVLPERVLAQKTHYD